MKLVELATTSVLLGIIGVACATLVHAQARLLRNVSDRTSGSEALRTASGIIAAELRATAVTDVRGIASDSVALRVHRGWGIVSTTADERIALEYSGLREPDPAKDSLLVVGTERSAAFTVVGNRPLEIQTETPLEPGTVVLFFESGAYHLSTYALRYRRGAEGRQPITDELIDHRASRFGLEAHGRLLRVNLRGRATNGSQPPQTSMRVRMLNQLP